MNIVNAGGRYQVYGEDVQTYKTLPAGTYTIGFHPQMGFWLQTHENLEVNEEIIYGSHDRKADKVLKSFHISERNFGIILSGKKGIGKSLLARIIANKAITEGLPVIIADTAIPGISNFLSSIQQEVVIIFDEFEKVFAKHKEDDPQVELLSLFDGIDSGKKLFIITCNDPRQLNEFLINRPGRFHYHLEISTPSADEVRAYMVDKLGTGWDEEIEKVIKLSQITDITFDVLRAIAFDLKQGYPLEETLSDLNINYEQGTLFDITVRLSNGAVVTSYSKSLDIYGKATETYRFYQDRFCFFVEFAPSAIASVDGTLCVPNDKVKLRLPWDAFEDTMNNDDADIARKQWLANTKITSCTLTKVNQSGINKYMV